MKSFFESLFSDKNNINEKSILGFASFIVMIIFAVSDIITGYLGKDLVVNEFIFNAFLVMTLGALGISSVDKYTNSKKPNDESQEN